MDRGNYPIVSFEHSDYVPSLAAASNDGTLRFGAQAAAVANEPGWSVLRSFKRMLVDAGPATEVQLGPLRMKVVDLFTAFLAHLRDELRLRSNAHLREKDRIEAAVSVPANASSAQRFLTVDAFRRANADYPWIGGATLFNLDYATVGSIPPTSEQFWFSLLKRSTDGSIVPTSAYTAIQEARRNDYLP